MSMVNLFVLFGLLMVVSVLFLWRRSRQKGTQATLKWELGKEVVVEYTPVFKVRDRVVQIKGIQSVSKNQIVQYAVIRKRWRLIPNYYGSYHIKGNYSKDRPFEHLFKFVPNGGGYQIEISHSGGVSQGELDVRGEKPAS
ncbi:hypothetical protein PU629_21260 [Pullulanibacillus sp. KACC 23026]|uniref:hypothetical protein n=1 Tax=Pullulanibacillus sp. KACC 23026 TaxID=3028315 RepID=UPI0023B1A6A6|nr:hypothetical protein [Pullulanibacillus sp. KACC 23026]WEG12586.1 hypothetical protein PU629_21260 [Pullulanibacillus sp. KACC 23026]